MRRPKIEMRGILSQFKGIFNRMLLCIRLEVKLRFFVFLVKAGIRAPFPYFGVGIIDRESVEVRNEGLCLFLGSSVDNKLVSARKQEVMVFHLFFFFIII